MSESSKPSLPLPPKITAPFVRASKARQKLVVVTAYDATFARLLDEGGADILLVGDSLGMVIQGAAHTLAVTLDEVIYHTRAVARGAQRAQVVADMPFMTSQVSVEDAMRSAGRLVKEGGAEAVKLEGGQSMAETVRRLVEAGIPVMGHVGLTPQSVHRMGGFRVQGQDPSAKQRIVADARALQDAGAYCIVVEGVPADVGEAITRAVEIPTIGIGAGPVCDGQVLVCYDLLGMMRDFKPKFVKHYAQLGDGIVDATRRFADEVRSGEFPTALHSFGAAPPGLAQGSTSAVGLPEQGSTVGSGEQKR